MKRTVKAMKSVAVAGALFLAISSSQVMAQQEVTPSIETHGSMEVSDPRGTQLPVLPPWNAHDHQIHIYFIGDPRGLLTIRNETTGEERNFKLAHFEDGDLVMDSLGWFTDPQWIRDITVEVSGNVDSLTFGGRLGPFGAPQFDGAGHASWTSYVLYE